MKTINIKKVIAHLTDYKNGANTAEALYLEL
jgi:hypothetical protein